MSAVEAERLRIAWWIRAGLTGPAVVNVAPHVRDALAELANLLEVDPERWADAPAMLHPSSPNRRTGS